MKRLLALFLISAATAAEAVDYVSVSGPVAILYDAPSLKAKKLFVVNRYMPFEQIVTLENWTKVRDHSGGMYWVEKKALSNKKYVFALNPLVDVYATPDASASKVFQVKQQVVLEVLESTRDGWLKVRHKDGDVGYVRSRDVWGQ